MFRGASPEKALSSLEVTAPDVTVPECYRPGGQDVEAAHGDLDGPDPVGLG